MDDLIGQRLGQYEIMALLGEGGMAAVYRARQTSVRRDVAIKIIKHNLIDKAEFVRRFEREAQTAASLSHPFILKIFDYGEQGPLVYLVMELLTGGTLASRIQKGPLPVDESTRILEQIASALDYAHHKGIIHRDLKPQNILLDEDGNAHLADFGIVKLMSEGTILTQTGSMMGTPAYIAPEQWRGKPIDARADVYALGVTLFEMLIGRLPFVSDTPFGLMHMHMYEAAPPLADLRSDLPTNVQSVINQALDKNPDKRFQSAGALSSAFKAALAAAPPRQAEAPKLSGEDLVRTSLPGSELLPHAANRLPTDTAQDLVVPTSTLTPANLATPEGVSTSPSVPTREATTPAPPAQPALPLAPPFAPTPANLATPEGVSTSLSAPTREAATTAPPAQIPAQATAPAPRSRQSGLIAAVIAIVVLVAFVVIFALRQSNGGSAITPPSVVAAASPLASNTALSVVPSMIVVAALPTSTATVTSTSLPSSATPVPPTASATLVPPSSTSTSLPPSATSIPLTATSIPPTGSEAVQTGTEADWQTEVARLGASLTAIQQSMVVTLPAQTNTVTPTVAAPTSTLPLTVTPADTATSTTALTPTVLTATVLTPAVLMPTALDTATSAVTAVPTSASTAAATSVPVTDLAAGSTRTDTAGIAQLWVPAACFQMGSDPATDKSAQPNEQPVHHVCLTSGYWIDTTEVTNAAFQQFIDSGGYNKRDYWSEAGWQWLQSNGKGPQALATGNLANQPRVSVSWYEAEAYSHWRGGSLPTEAQWEYAARGPNSLIYPWGNTWDAVKANTSASGIASVSVVGSYPAGKSWIGALDMSGNAWEWTADRYGSNYYSQSPKNDPTGPTTGEPRVLRGGAWDSIPVYARTAYRYRQIPESRSNNGGFRVVSPAGQ